MKRLEVERIGRKIKQVCATCGADAWVDISNYGRQVNAYCSAECRKQASSAKFNRRVTLSCSQCGKSFALPPSHAARYGMRFCSSACYGLYQRSNPHGGSGVVAQPAREHVCKACGVTYRASALRGTSGYCSAVCRRNALGKDKVCEHCGRPFHEYHSGGKQSFCSLECKKAHTPVCTCKRCGKEFYGHPGANRSYCSEECRRPPVIVTCLNCQRDFRVVPTLAPGRRFCSAGCYRRFTGETEPERNARLILEAHGIAFEQEYVVKGWRYPVDFYLPDTHTMLEIDEPYWHSKVLGRDARKTALLESKGYRVVRFVATPLYGEVTDDAAALLLNAIGV